MSGDPNLHGVRLRGRFHLTRSSHFSYACQACMRCCQHKRIPLNPYEVARLASHVGLTTTAFLAQHTEIGGAILKRRADETCVFLGEKGCTVHASRPLACRLYPLGRQRAASGDELFAEIEPHPGSLGIYGDDGTVDDFLRSQDVARHVEMADRYGDVLARMLTVLAQLDGAREAQDEAVNALEAAPITGEENLLDMDATVERHVATRGGDVPTELDAKAALHIEALEAFVASLTPRS